MHPPTTVKSVKRLKETKLEADGDQTLRHRHFLTSRVKKGGSPTLDRIPLLFNADVAMLYVEPTVEDEHFYRNAQADEVVYVSKGAGTLETQFGDLPFGEGDYVVIHRGIMHRYRFDAGERAGEAADHGGQGAHPPSQALSQRVRTARSKARPTRSATSAFRASCRRTTRWATSASS